MIEVVVNANSIAYMTTNPETLTWNSRIYAPIPATISVEEQGAQGELPQIFIDVANYGGRAFSFANDNDITLNDVTIRQVSPTLTSSGADARVTMQVLGAAFSKDMSRFNLGWAFNYDAEGPKRTWNRRDHPSIPFAFGQYAFI
jgi:hypothetical protein